MDRHLKKKLVEEKPLAPCEALELDEALESSEQMHVSQWVRALDDPAPNMVWRSQLNAKLAAKPSRRPRWIWGSAATTVAAALVLGAVWYAERSSTPQGVGPGSQPSIEEVLVQSHDDADCVEVTDDRVQTVATTTSNDWVDVDSL